MSRPTRALARAGVLAIAIAVAPCLAADWKAEPSASKLEFVATFEGSAVPGVFRSFDARLRLDPERPADGSLEVTVDVSSARTGIADVDREIAGAAWFDFARHPRATFRSTGMRRIAGGRYVASGTLSLKGATAPVDVPFAFTTSPGGARLDGEFTVRRGDFGIGSGEWAATTSIGADVKVRFAVKLAGGG